MTDEDIKILARQIKDELIKSPAGIFVSGFNKLVFTPREQEVALLIAEGWSNREVASRLFISIKTVEQHTSRMYRALDGLFPDASKRHLRVMLARCVMSTITASDKAMEIR